MENQKFAQLFNISWNWLIYRVSKGQVLTNVEQLSEFLIFHYERIMRFSPGKSGWYRGYYVWSYRREKCGTYWNKTYNNDPVPMQCFNFDNKSCAYNMNALQPDEGHLISECKFGFLNFAKTNKKIWQTSALASKEWSNQQNKGSSL